MNTEQTDRQEILEKVKAYTKNHLIKGDDFKPGDRIPYAARVFDEEELTALVDTSLDFWLTAGEKVAAFEADLAAYLGVKYAAFVNSGSSANLLAFGALCSPKLGDRRIKPGDEVITVAAGFPTTITPIIQYGAVPVFVDVTLPQYNVNVAALEKAVGEKTKAVILAHTMGNPFDVAKVKEICDRNGLWLIEDNCDSLGAEVRVDGEMKKTGTVGDIGTSSFYPPHHMTTGEGGALYTDNLELFRIIESLKDWGRDCHCKTGEDNLCGNRFTGQYGELPYGYDHKYVFSQFGYNLKATEMQAAIGIAQLKKLPGFVQKRRENWRTIRAGLEPLAHALLLPETLPESLHSPFGLILSVKPEAKFDRAGITAYIESKNIQTRTLFAGNIVKHPCFDEMRKEKRGYRVAGERTATDRIMFDTFWIGVYPGLSKAQIDYMIQTITEYVTANE